MSGGGRESPEERARREAREREAVQLASAAFQLSASVPASLDALLRAAGILVAAISADAGGLERNVEMTRHQLERFARAGWRNKTGVPPDPEGD